MVSSIVALKICELISIVLLTFVSGMYWGPWLAVSRSFAAFKPPVLLPVVSEMGHNIGPLMTVLVPAALLSVILVLVLSYHLYSVTFFLALAALALFILTLVVTMLVEVPIVMQMTAWTVSTLPSDWQQLRDRWGAFHLLRVVPSIVGLVLLLVGAIFTSA